MYVLTDISSTTHLVVMQHNALFNFKSHTHTTQPFYGHLEFCLGLPGWAGTRKVKPKPIWISWSKR